MDKLLRFFGLIRFSIANKRVGELHTENVDLIKILEANNIKYRRFDNSCHDAGKNSFGVEGLVNRVKYQEEVIEKFEAEVELLKERLRE